MYPSLWEGQHKGQKLRPLCGLFHGSYPRGIGKLWDLEKVKVSKLKEVGIQRNGRMRETGGFLEKV